MIAARSSLALFGVGCLLSRAYGFLSGAWPFGVIELVWSLVAFARSRRMSKGLDATAP